MEFLYSSIEISFKVTHNITILLYEYSYMTKVNVAYFL